MNPKRHGNRWTINEILKLQRECELLEMNVEEIASNHERSVNSILSKIEQEEFVFGNNQQSQLNTNTDPLVTRVDHLETSVLKIKGMVKQVVSHYMETRRQKQKRLLKPLRKQQSSLSS